MISVIIPVYNSESTLSACIESVIAQTYSNLAIILVDDCSTDNSLAKCKEYEKRDTRIRTIHHETNKGVGAARNTGLQFLSGDYVSFVDSDDTIQTKMYETMLTIMKEDKCHKEYCR